MSRYLLFAGYGRKAAGGYDDYVGSRPSVDAMKLLFDKTNIGSKQVKEALLPLNLQRAEHKAA